MSFTITLYLLSPFINQLIKSFDKKTFKLFLLLVLFLFSVWAYGVDALSSFLGDKILRMNTITQLGSINGYTIIQFILMYLIGAFIKRMNLVIVNIGACHREQCVNFCSGG